MRMNARACHLLGWTIMSFIIANLSASGALGQALIVDRGQARADIVIAENPSRATKLAALELQDFIEKISDGKPVIVTEPGRDNPVHIYIGASKHTDRLNISDEGLEYDAFRMVSGDGWLVLLGSDKESGDATSLGQDIERLRGLSLSETDGRGSLNAVYEFLRGVGCRWYFPGEIGEIVPKMETIALPEINRTISPDFRLRHMRQWYYSFYQTPGDHEILWQLRLGINSSRRILGSPRGHGIIEVYRSEEVQKNHPEYFALWGGKRAIGHADGAPCLSSEGLFEANVEYVRSMFDKGEPVISVAPSDGYTTLCQCDFCKGKDTPERGYNGLLSDYVWDYVNRVAIEVYKTHPEKKITCIAYTTYLLPPEKIEELSPNIAIILCRWRSHFINRSKREDFTNLLDAWLEKMPSKEVYIWDYYLHSRPGGTYEGIPVYFPHIIDEDLKSLKGISGGDYIEVSRNAPDWGKKWHAMATNHLNVYVTARLYWDVDQDVDAMLDEYYTNFYGPAAEEMKGFVEYCEKDWPESLKDAAVIDRFVEMLDDAQAKAGDTIFGKRVGMVVDYIQPLLAKRSEIDKGRKDAPVAVAKKRDGADFTLDGKLDGAFWDGLETYPLRELAHGGEPDAKTTFKVAWDEDFLYFAIRCAEEDMKNLRVGTTKNEDSNVWKGDEVELMLETPTHAYYQIAISPVGAIMDVDWKNGFDTTWSSGAEVAVQHGDDFWTVEVRVPIAGAEADQVDDKSGVSGDMPREGDPWFFNVCRQRMRGDTRQLSGFSPTGSGFLNPDKFGKLLAR
ncbi:MAG: DUF4838 domain-containing protein [Gemmatimonadetes bacterium]|jgi:hypothetical protein|nr:DUF4838 domain-containing protein [Gemmatimonadota bacterium]